MAFDVKNTSIQITAVDKTKVAFDSIRASLAGLTSGFSGLTAALGLGAFAAMTKRTIDQADAFNDLSKRTGIAVEQIGAWRLITEQSGTSMESLTQALGKGSRYLVQHGADLKKIGIQAQTSEELILQLSGVISKMDSDDPRRMALAMQVFGKSAGELVPLLSEGEAGLRKMLERGRELNPITQQLANESDQFNDTLAEMKLQASGLGVAIVKDLLPGLNTFLQKMQMAVENGNGFSGFFGAIYDGMKETRGRVASRDRLNEIPERMKFLAGGLPTASAAERARIGFELKSLANEKNNLMRSLGMIKDEKKALTTNAKFDEASINSFLKSGSGSEKTKRDTVGDRIREMERENALLGQGKTMEEARMVARLQAEGASKAQIETLLRLNGVQTQWEETQKASEKAQEDLKKATEDHNEAMRRMLETADEAVISAQREYEESQRGLQVLQLGESAVIRMEAARLQEAAASAEQGLAYARLNGLSEENINFTEAQIFKLKELAKARLGLADSTDAKTAFEKEKDRIDDLAKEQKRAADDVLKYQKDNARELSQAFTNGFFDSFKKGESFGRAMIKNIVAFGKTWLARLFEGFFTGNSAQVSGLLGGFGSLFSGGASAVANPEVLTGKGSGSIFGQLSSIKDIFSGGNNFITGAFTSGIEKLGVLFANGNGGIADAIGGFLGANAGGIAGALPFAGAALQALTGDIKGAAFTAIGAAVGGPIGAALGGIAGSLFGGKKLPPRVTESRTGIYTNGAFSAFNGADPGKRKLGAAGALDDINSQFSSILGGFLSNFGIDATIGTNSLLTKKKNVRARFNASVNGVNVAGYEESFGKKGDFNAAAKALADNALGPVLARAIQASSVGAGIKKFFDGLTKKEDVLEAVNTLSSLKAQLVDLPPVFDALRNAIDTTAYRTSIADLKTRFSAIGTYTSLFYTAEEQFATFTKQLTTSLGALGEPLFSTREQFRALVDGIKVVDEATSNQFNGLVALAPAMDAYFKQLEAQKEQSEAVTGALRDESNFKTQYDYNFYKGIADNYGGSFANRFIDGAPVTYGASNNTSVALPTVSPSNNTTISTSDPNMLNAMSTLIAKFNELQGFIAKIQENTKSAAETLVNVTGNGGDALQTVAAP